MLKGYTFTILGHDVTVNHVSEYAASMEAIASMRDTFDVTRADITETRVGDPHENDLFYQVMSNYGLSGVNIGDMVLNDSLKMVVAGVSRAGYVELISMESSVKYLHHPTSPSINYGYAKSGGRAKESPAYTVGVATAARS